MGVLTCAALQAAACHCQALYRMDHRLQILTFQAHQSCSAKQGLPTDALFPHS